MVLTNKYTQDLVVKLKNFAKSKSFAETVELYSDDGQVSAYTVFTGLTDYVVDELIKINNSITNEEIEIYGFVEEIRENYSNYLENTEEFDYDNAACVCFLENLQNRASAGRIEYSRFIPYLGEKSKEFCRTWDEFTGVKSEGLWDDFAN